MTEHPFFVPADDGQVAAVLTLPVGTPRGVAVLIQGGGATRSHRRRMWTMVARALAERGIASVRTDHPWIGDSTGSDVPGSGMLPIARPEAALRVAQAVTGTRAWCVVGNCVGARAGFSMATRDPDCRSVACLVFWSPDPLLAIDTVAGRPHRRPRRDPVSRAIRRLLRVAGRDTDARRFRPDVEAGAAHVNSLFLFIGREQVGRRLVRDLRALERRARVRPLHAIEWRSLAVPQFLGFRVPLEHQAAFVDTLVDFVDRTMPVEPGPAEAAPPVAAARPAVAGTR